MSEWVYIRSVLCTWGSGIFDADQYASNPDLHSCYLTSSSSQTQRLYFSVLWFRGEGRRVAWSCRGNVVQEQATRQPSPVWKTCQQQSHCWMLSVKYHKECRKKNFSSLLIFIVFIQILKVGLHLWNIILLALSPLPLPAGQRRKIKQPSLRGCWFSSRGKMVLCLVSVSCKLYTTGVQPSDAQKTCHWHRNWNGPSRKEAEEERSDG